MTALYPNPLLIANLAFTGDPPPQSFVYVRVNRGEPDSTFLACRPSCSFSCKVVNLFNCCYFMRLQLKGGLTTREGFSHRVTLRFDSGCPTDVDHGLPGVNFPDDEGPWKRAPVPEEGPTFTQSGVPRDPKHQNVTVSPQHQGKGVSRPAPPRSLVSSRPTSPRFYRRAAPASLPQRGGGSPPGPGLGPPPRAPSPTPSASVRGIP